MPTHKHDLAVCVGPAQIQKQSVEHGSGWKAGPYQSPGLKADAHWVQCLCSIGSLYTPLHAIQALPAMISESS
jgi:hypothetical protein